VTLRAKNDISHRRNTASVLPVSLSLVMPVVLVF